MALGNFYEIMIGIIGNPINDYQAFVLYTVSAILGLSIILFVFYLFYLVARMFKVRQK